MNSWQSDVPQVCFITLNADLARELLALSEPWRLAALRPELVDCYAEQMHQGRWPFNGDTIKVNRSGNLLDGQHRLHAVIKSGWTGQALVCLGVPDEAAWVMDPPGPRV